jgi:hypothetical protein
MAEAMPSRSIRMTLWIGMWAWLGLALCGVCVAQQGGATGTPLVVQTTSVPKGYVGQHYEARLTAQGGITPLKWVVSEGSLPPGMGLHLEGVLVGVPSEVGEFKFTVTVSDSGNPAYERRQPFVLVVVTPMFLQWGKYPVVNGGRIEGSVLVSNQTDGEFDLTVIAVAVNEDGRATALGYQHFPVKKNTTAQEIPFGENLPPGSYQVDVDGMGESAPVTIYRARLVPKERLVVAAGP